ncbi:hypothetical protein AAG906_015218 [Vitis piasezkii]
MCGSDNHLAWKCPIFSRCARVAYHRRDRRFVLSLDLPSWVRVEGRLVRFSKRSDMDKQVVTVDQFTTAMASIQEALVSLKQEIGNQQSRPPVAPPPVVHTIVIDDTHACMDRIESTLRQLRVPDSSAIWDDLEGCPTLRGTQALVVLAFTSDFTAQ